MADDRDDFFGAPSPQKEAMLFPPRGTSTSQSPRASLLMKPMPFRAVEQASVSQANLLPIG
jgi:hypothetical protein